MTTVAVHEWEEQPTEDPPVRRPRASALQGVWRASELSSKLTETVSTCWHALDAELPGAGWPRRSITEVLTPQPAVIEWRLLGGAIRRIVEAGGQVVMIGPPKHPHVPGLMHEGAWPCQLIWVQAETPAERLWATEQVIKSDAAGLVIAWLPQARQEQIRRLQVCALACQAPVFLCRPEASRYESSAAPLRVHCTFGLDWELHVDVFKRRGPALDAPLRLPSVPGGLASILTPRLLRPSRMIQRKERVDADVLGSPAPRTRQLAVH